IGAGDAIVVRGGRGQVVVVVLVHQDVVALAVAQGLHQVVGDRRGCGEIIGGDLVAEDARRGRHRDVFRERDAETDFAGGIARAVARRRGGRVAVVAVAERVTD